MLEAHALRTPSTPWRLVICACGEKIKGTQRAKACPAWLPRAPPHHTDQTCKPLVPHQLVRDVKKSGMDVRETYRTNIFKAPERLHLFRVAGACRAARKVTCHRLCLSLFLSCHRREHWACPCPCSCRICHRQDSCLCHSSALSVLRCVPRPQR